VEHGASLPVAEKPPRHVWCRGWQRAGHLLGRARAFDAIPAIGIVVFTRLSDLVDMFDSKQEVTLSHVRSKF
jgi:hypothetical protein